MAGHGSETFQPMEALLATWLAGARLPEAVCVVQPVKAELNQRGVVLNWSVSQIEVEGPVELGSRDQGPSRQPFNPWPTRHLHS